MSDLSIFKLDSQTITIKDTTAREAADSAKTLATTASGNATTALNKINELESEISSLKSDLANKLYPVGSIYMSVNATNPAELFGGTWERIKDRFLLAAGNTYAAGSTGGEAQHTLTVDEMPSHFHEHIYGVSGSQEIYFENNSGDSSGAHVGNNTSNQSSDYRSIASTGNAGGSTAHNNMPPYLAVYMWKRTA